MNEEEDPALHYDADPDPKHDAIPVLDPKNADSYGNSAFKIVTNQLFLL